MNPNVLSIATNDRLRIIAIIMRRVTASAVKPWEWP